MMTVLLLFAIRLILPSGIGIVTFELPLVIVPAETVCKSSKYNVAFDNHKSFQRLVELPKLYVTLAAGIKLVDTNFDIDKLFTDTLPVNAPATAPTLPTLALPVTLNLPTVVKLPPDTLPVAVINPAVPKLPTLALLVTVNTPPVDMLPPDRLPVIVANPETPRLPTLALPEIDIAPDIPILPTLALPVTLNEPPVDRLPPVMLPVAFINPPVPKLPTLALPVTLNAPPVVKLPPDTLPVAVINPLAPRLPRFALPFAFNVPETLTPVPVTTNTFDTPTALMFTLPLADGILTLLLPLLTPVALELNSICCGYAAALVVIVIPVPATN